jgi:ribonucleotide monophosphatase NagD (HAD superfamily)
LEIADGFDAFLFDAYGVFYDGHGFFPGSIETMAELRARGKKVAVLSNNPTSASSSRGRYAKEGLLKGVHYDEFVTSGEVANWGMRNGKFDLGGYRYYTFGTKGKPYTEGTGYVEVDAPEDADFIYLTCPVMSDAERDGLEPSMRKLLVEKPVRPGVWYGLELEPFLPRMREVFEYGLPMFNPNPDFRSQEKAVGRDGSVFIAVEGMVAEEYRRSGGTVVEVGKPHELIYDYALGLLADFDRPRVLMVGDTVRTDIRGAKLAGIKSALCVETGIVADEISRGGNLGDIFARDGATPDFLIKSVG